MGLAYSSVLLTRNLRPELRGVIVIAKSRKQKKVDMPVMGSVNVPYIKAIDVHICPKNSDTCGVLISLRR